MVGYGVLDRTLIRNSHSNHMFRTETTVIKAVAIEHQDGCRTS